MITGPRIALRTLAETAPFQTGESLRSSLPPEMRRFLEPGQFLLAYEASRLWVYFDAFESASTNMRDAY